MKGKLYSCGLAVKRACTRLCLGVVSLCFAGINFLFTPDQECSYPNVWPIQATLILWGLKSGVCGHPHASVRGGKWAGDHLGEVGRVEPCREGGWRGRQGV